MSGKYDGPQYQDPMYSMPKDSQTRGIIHQKDYRDLRVKKVENYTRPRYVYANGEESEFPQCAFGDVIGYRISPTLVISDMCADGNGWFLENLVAFIKKYGGAKLTMDEVAILRQNYDKINKMRRAIGDTPLPYGYFWAEGRTGYSESVHCKDDEEEYDPDTSNIILKRLLAE